MKKMNSKPCQLCLHQLLGKVMQKIECFRSDTGIFTSYLYYISMFIFFKHVFIKNICSKFLILCLWCWCQGWSIVCRRKRLRGLNDQNHSRMTENEIFHEVKLLQIYVQLKFRKLWTFSLMAFIIFHRMLTQCL